MRKSTVAFVITLCVLFVGMILCAFLAAQDNFSSENAEGNTLLWLVHFVSFLIGMIMFFFMGQGIAGYENLGDYFVHNVVFYVFFVAIIITVVVFCIMRAKKKKAAQ